jgi:phi13 family phage major tail protein
MATTIGLKDLVFCTLDKEGITGANYDIEYTVLDRLPGLRNATIDVELNQVDIVGDDRIMDTLSESKSINLTFETVDMTNAQRAKLLGQKIVNGQVSVNVDDEPLEVAIGFKAQKRKLKGDTQLHYRRVWLLKGKLQPISDSYQTKGDSIEPKYNNMTFRFIPRIDGNLQVISDTDRFDGQTADSPTDAVFFHVDFIKNNSAV